MSLRLGENPDDEKDFPEEVVELRGIEGSRSSEEEKLLNSKNIDALFRAMYVRVQKILTGSGGPYMEVSDFKKKWGNMIRDLLNEFEQKTLKELIFANIKGYNPEWRISDLKNNKYQVFYYFNLQEKKNVRLECPKN